MNTSLTGPLEKFVSELKITNGSYVAAKSKLLQSFISAICSKKQCVVTINIGLILMLSQYLQSGYKIRGEWAINQEANVKHKTLWSETRSNNYRNSLTMHKLGDSSHATLKLHCSCFWIVSIAQFNQLKTDISFVHTFTNGWDALTSSAVIQSITRGTLSVVKCSSGLSVWPPSHVHCGVSVIKMCLLQFQLAAVKWSGSTPCHVADKVYYITNLQCFYLFTVQCHASVVCMLSSCICPCVDLGFGIEASFHTSYTLCYIEIQSLQN